MSATEGRDADQARHNDVDRRCYRLEQATLHLIDALHALIRGGHLTQVREQIGLAERALHRTPPRHRSTEARKDEIDDSAVVLTDTPIDTQLDGSPLL